MQLSQATSALQSRLMRGRREQKKKWRKRQVRIIAVLAGLPVALCVIAVLVVHALIDEKFLREEIEQSVNCEVEIEDVDVSILHIPAKVTMQGVRFLPKRGSALLGAGGAESNTGVQVDEIQLSVGLWSLLKQHINVTNIAVRGADISSVYRENGTMSVGDLFESPENKKRREKNEGSGIRGGFNAIEEHELVATLGGLSIENSRVNLTLESTGLQIRCSDVDIVLGSIHVDPEKLEKINTAELKMSGRMRLDSVKGWQYGDVSLSGESTVRIFNPKTGDIEPDVEGVFHLGEDSWLNTSVPFITKAWNHLEVLEKVGIRVVKQPEKAMFGRSQSVAVHYHKGLITVRQPLSLWIGDWELAVLDGSWMQAETNQHEMQIELLASKKSSIHFRKLIGKGLEIVPEAGRKLAAKNVEERLFRDNRLLVKIKSGGDFSDPEIRPVGAIVDLAEAAKDAAKKLFREKAGRILDGFLKKEDGEGKD